MSYKHKSGAQKRKEKDDREFREREAKKGQLSLGHFFKIPDSVSLSPDTELTEVELAVNTSSKTDAIISPTPTDKDIFVPENESAESETENYKIETTANATSSTSILVTTSQSHDETTSSAPCIHFDVGDPSFDASIHLKYNHFPMPERFPDDITGSSVPTSVFKKKLTNGDLITRDWLVWSQSKKAFFCLPCKVFSSLPHTKRSSLALPEGFSSKKRWKKLFDKVPEHENSSSHKHCYIQWKSEVIKSKKDKNLTGLILNSILQEKEKWRDLLKRLLNVTLFLAERGLAFRGTNEKIGDPSNGNFLGILELLANYDPVLNEHLNKVRLYQTKGERMQVHYLSHDIQNEFIELCSSQVTKVILEEREKARYYSVIVDATPDSAHIEQTAFILRYVHETEEESEPYKVQERLLCFADCTKKSGKDIAELILSTLKRYEIPIEDCKGQGYDNGSNMKGAYKGAQAFILSANSEAVYSACTCHSLNLCGEQAAECCPAAITFFGAVQKLYNIFSSSPQRWDILKNKIPGSLHSMSKTRWSARVDSVRPVAAHLPGIVEALEEVIKLNLTAECRRDVEGLKKYFKSFNCLLLASVWYKILKPIDTVNRVLQNRGETLDVASKNLSQLIEDLKVLRNDGWDKIFNEVLVVAENIGWPQQLEEEEKRRRKRKRAADEDDEVCDDNTEHELDAKTTFKNEVFNVILDSVIGDMTVRFKSVSDLCSNFSVLWSFKEMPDDLIETKSAELVQRHQKDLGTDLLEELVSLKQIYEANFGGKTLLPFELLKKIKLFNLESLFPNLTVALRIFATIPATVASAERSFSVLNRIKNVLRSTMCQNRLSSLGVLAVEMDLVKRANVDRIIDEFASRKARRGVLL